MPKLITTTVVGLDVGRVCWCSLDGTVCAMGRATPERTFRKPNSCTIQELQVFFYYGQKNIFVDLHVSGDSKTFSPL